VRKAKTKLSLEDLQNKLYQRALRFLSFRARSKKEISDYLQKIINKKGKKTEHTQILVDKVIKKLKSLNLINDQEFALWWIEQRQNLNPKGKKALRLELRQKGVDQKTIEQSLASIDPLKLEESARQIIAKKVKLYPHLSSLKFKKKLLSLLLRRGFDYQLSRKVIDEKVKKR
jgi:regulatory protein